MITRFLHAIDLRVKLLVLTVDALCAGKQGHGNAAGMTAAQHVDALRMHACLKGLLGQNNAKDVCTSSKQHGNSLGSNKLPGARTGAAVAELSVACPDRKEKRHGQCASVGTMMKGYMQEDTLFAFSTTKS